MRNESKVIQPCFASLLGPAPRGRLSSAALIIDRITGNLRSSGTKTLKERLSGEAAWRPRTL